MTSSAPLAPSLSELRDRLSGGTHPQDLLDEVVQSPALCAGDGGVFIDCILFLADRGAKVATGEPGCAFEKIARRAPVAAIDLIPGLAPRPGELPFHVIAGIIPLLISPPKLRNQDFQASLLARDPMGRTVSHCLWDAAGALVQLRPVATGTAPELDTDRRNNEKIWRDCMVEAWQTQQTLLDCGFSMELPDHQGRTALDLCVDRLEAGDLWAVSGYPDLGAKAQACLAKRQMTAQTIDPAPASRTPRGPRL